MGVSLGFDPLSATGVILRYDYDSGRAFFAGTCFAFRVPNVVLTAAHCVPEPEDNDYYRVHFPHRGDNSRPVTRIVRHPTADIALVELPAQLGESGAERYDNAFWGHVSNLALGEEFMSFGFPTEGPDTSESEAVPRLFRGHYQRYFEYSGSRSYRYLAGELSIATPAGLSGAAVFRPGAPQMVSGLVTGIHESYAIIDSYEELTVPGEKTKYENRRVISYGVALLLHAVDEWLGDAGE